MTKYRVFIGYNKDDEDFVSELTKMLIDIGLEPKSMKDFVRGIEFLEQIHFFIESCHLFIPIIPSEEEKRGWINQEIGYALARKKPILPLTHKQLPEQMLQQLLSVTLSPDINTLRDVLNYQFVDKLIMKGKKRFPPLYDCAPTKEKRTEMMIDFAEDSYCVFGSGCVRQKAILSSFHIPDIPINDYHWEIRWGKDYKESDDQCQNLRKERQILEKHVIEKGCRLIINPLKTFKHYNKETRISRLQMLLDFLKSEKINEIIVAINSEMQNQNLTIVGDWFSAQSIKGTFARGYEQTIFTRNALAIFEQIEEFDHELKTMLKNQEISEKDSRQKAIEKIERIVNDLESGTIHAD